MTMDEIVGGVVCRSMRFFIEEFGGVCCFDEHAPPHFSEFVSICFLPPPIQQFHGIVEWEGDERPRQEVFYICAGKVVGTFSPFRSLVRRRAKTLKKISVNLFSKAESALAWLFGVDRSGFAPAYA